jgi:hypothetical protein
MAKPKPTRLETSLARRHRFWAARINAAVTPREKAAVEWNWLRAEVHKVPPERRAEAWATLRRHLRNALDEIREDEARVAEQAEPYPSSRPDPLPVRAARYLLR